MHIALHNAPDLTQPITVIELILLAVIIAQINQDHVIQYDKGLIILRMHLALQKQDCVSDWILVGTLLSCDQT